MNAATTALVAAILLGGPGDESSRNNDSIAVVKHCQVFLIRDVDVPAQETGRLIAVNTIEGQQVKQGRVLARIDDQQAQIDKLAAELERDAAKARADDDIEVRYAEKSFELADAELNQNLEINRRSPGAVALADIRRQKLAKHRAELHIDKSRLDLKVARMNAEVQNAAVEAMDQNILRRQILAPFDGMVIDVMKQTSEWVNSGEPVLRVVQMDELRVDGFLSGAQYDTSSIAGRDVTVEVELARGRVERFAGQVVFVNPIIQAGNKFRVRANVQNRQVNGHWLLQPGRVATMIIHLD